MAVPNANEINQSYFIDPNEELYNIEGKTGEVDVEAFATDDTDDKKSSLRSTDYIPSGSATVDLSEEAQVNNLLQYDATTGEPYVDNFNDAVNIYKGITTEMDYRRNYDTNKSKSQQNNTGSPKSFDNINADNFFERKVGSIQGTATTIAKKIGGIYSLDKGPEGAFISGMMGSIMGGGFPFATAAVWMGYGYQQEKDKNNFIKKLSSGGITELLADPNKGYKYTGKNDMNASQYMNHILYNSFNPGYDLKKYAEMGKSPQEALANFMNTGIDNGVFKQEDILKMGSSRHDMQPGSDSYMKAWAAEKALKDKGWSGRGRLWTDPQGNQWLDGNLWKPVKTQTSDTGGTDTGGTDTGNGVSFDSNQGYNFTTNDNYSAKGSGTQSGQANPHTESGFSGGNSNTGGANTSSVSSSPPSGPDLTNRKLGGVVHLQEGGTPEQAMMAQMQNQPVEEAGNLEMVSEPNKDMSGVADDVPRKLEEGDFVINAPAVEMAGRSDVERMVTKAITELQRKGVKLDFGTAADDVDSMVDALVSNGEMIIPKVLAEQIGYDRLEKINNRGKERVEAKEKERQQIQQNPTQPNPQQGMMAVGGQVNLDENKNQPIAVPQESFAGQSSVGKKLLSPMSPEAQDDEKELANRSQSFEGFMKPVKLAPGGEVLTRGDRNNNPFNLESNPNTNRFFGVVGNDMENLSRDMPKDGFLKFDNSDNGLRAGFRNLIKNYNGLTAEEIGKKYTVTNQDVYIKAIQSILGDGPIDMTDSNNLLKLGKIIIQNEGNSKNYSDSTLLQAINSANINKPDSTAMINNKNTMIKSNPSPSGMMGK